MVSSAPSLSFSPVSLNFGTIDVGTSCDWNDYKIFNASASYAAAMNMSVSFKASKNSDEAGDESWVHVSTAKESGPITISKTGGKEIQGQSVPARQTQRSILYSAKVLVPAGAATSGTVKFALHHRYQYTG